jgi:hypothetical protein
MYKCLSNSLQDALMYAAAKTDLLAGIHESSAPNFAACKAYDCAEAWRPRILCADEVTFQRTLALYGPEGSG